MSRLHIATRGACDWRSRLSDPTKHWQKKASAMETAVIWESASHTASGLPEPICTLFRESDFGEPDLLFAVAEHKVRLRGTGGDSQCDVWALVKCREFTVSMTVEAKAKETFGNKHEPLLVWKASGSSARSEPNRLERWQHIQENLPILEAGTYESVPFQILQRCAAAVIEARRFGLRNAVFIVQAFSSPTESFEMFARFTAALSVPPEKNRLHFSTVGEVRLGIGWVDCPFANDAQMASVL